MKKKLLSFFALAVIGVLAYAATQAIQPTRRAGAVDITIDAADITDGDITAALKAKTDALTEGETVGNITINLDKATAYKVTAAIKTPESLTIEGNGATIDASAADVEGGVNFIELQGSAEYALKADGVTVSDHFKVESVTIKDVTITGLKKAIVRDTQKTYLKTLTIDNSVIEASNGKPAIDFDGKGYVEQLNVTKSTIWAKEATNKNFTKYGSRPKNLWTKDAEDKDVPGPYTVQGYDVENSTFVNIAATGQNFCNNSQKGTAQNVYTIKNNVFVDCGKPNQVVVGFNGGQTSANPVWDVDGNVFNAGGADGSAAEVSKAGKKDDADIVKNSIAGMITFTDAAAGTFDGTFATTSDITSVTAGDPRWTITVEKLDVATLDATIATAEGLLEGKDATVADSPEKTLSDAIAAAKAAKAAAKSQAEVDAANSALETAIEAYKTATGINAISVDGVSGDIFSDGKPVYNLSGQRVFKGYKGVVIKNGKKVVIK